MSRAKPPEPIPPAPAPAAGGEHRRRDEREALERVFHRVRHALRDHRPHPRLRRLGAEEDFDRLMALAPAQRLPAVERDPRLQCVGVAEAALSLARAGVAYQPESAEELITLAQGLIDRLFTQAREEKQRAEVLLYLDVLALAASVRARALHALGHPGLARGAYRQAYANLARGSGDPALAAEVHEQAALFLLDADELESGHTLLLHALEQNELLGQPRAAFCFLELARLKYLFSDAEGALAAQNQGLNRMPRDHREPLRFAAAGIERARILLDLDQVEEARATLQRARALAWSFPALIPHHQWAGALITWRLGRPDLAEDTLWAALANFREQHPPREALRMTLDLLRVRLALGDPRLPDTARWLCQGLPAAKLAADLERDLRRVCRRVIAGRFEPEQLARHLDQLAAYLRLPGWRTRRHVH